MHAFSLFNSYSFYVESRHKSPNGSALPMLPTYILKRGTAPTFRPIFIVAKRLDASRCHFVWR